MSTRHRLKPRFRIAAAGQGLMLMIVFVFTALVALTSLQFMSATVAPTVLRADNQNIALKSAANYAMSQLLMNVTWWINYYGFTPTTGWTDPNNPYTINPQDNPACNTFNCPTPATPITGNGSVIAANGYSYTLQVVVTNGTSSLTKTQTYYLNPFSCSGVENAVHSGQLGSISDNKLKRYAQQACPAALHAWGWGWMQSPTAGTGTSGGNCTTNIGSAYNYTPDATGSSPPHTATGLLDLANASSSCSVNIDKNNQYTFYSDVRFNSVIKGTINSYAGAQRTLEIASINSSSGGTVTVSLFPDSKDGTDAEQDIEIGSLTSGVSSKPATVDASGITSPSYFFIGSVTGTAYLTVKGTNSTVGWGDTYNIGSAWNGGTLYLSPGGNTLFAEGLSGGTLDSSRNNSNWWGSNITTNSMTGGTIKTGGGWDNISCAQAFGGDGGCSAVNNVTIYPAYLDATHLQDNGGGDSVYLGQPPGTSTLVKMGNSGGNVVYFKGQTAGTINMGSGNGNLVIIDGDRTGGTLTCTGSSNNIILLKNGAAIGPNVTGFNRTITY